MASRPRRYTAEEVLQRLQEIDSDESTDDEPSTLLTQHNLEATTNDSSCESSGDEPAMAPIRYDLEAAPNGNSSGDKPAVPTPLTLTASSGTVWTNITGQLGAGRVPLVNVFRARTGPTAYGNVRAVSPISAFKLFIDQPMLQTIRNHTVARGKIDEPVYDVSVNELCAFIGLQLARGIFVGKKYFYF